MKPRLRPGPQLLGATIAALWLATELAAQTLPVPVLPPEPVPEPEAARARPWEYVLGAGVGWDGNIDFLLPHGPRGVLVEPRGGLARVFSGPHAQLRATASGASRLYPGRNDLRRYNAELGLDGSYHASPSTEWRGSVSGGFGYSDSSEILLDQGVSLPVVKTRSLAASLGLSKRVGTRGSLRVDGRFYRTEFASPGLVDGSSVRGTLGLDRRLSDRSTAAIQYSLESVGPDQAGSYLTHFASLQWTRRLSPRSAILLEAGTSATPDAARAGLDRRQSFFGGASVARQSRRSSLTLFLRREVTPAFGTSQSRLELRSGVRAALPLGRAWQLRLVASHVRPESRDAVEEPSASSGDAFAALARRLGRRFEVSGEARYRRRGKSAALPAIESFQAGLFLTVSTPGAAAIATAPGL